MWVGGWAPVLAGSPTPHRFCRENKLKRSPHTINTTCMQQIPAIYFGIPYIFNPQPRTRRCTYSFLPACSCSLSPFLSLLLHISYTPPSPLISCFITLDLCPSLNLPVPVTLPPGWFIADFPFCSLVPGSSFQQEQNISLGIEILLEASSHFSYHGLP